MAQLNSSKPCSDREHIESIEKPGFCVWCDAPMAEQHSGAVRWCPNCRAKNPIPTQTVDVWTCGSCGAVWKRATPKTASYHGTGWLRDSMAAQAPFEPATFPLPTLTAGELAAHGSVLLSLLAAVADGATLILGPAGEYAATAHGIVGFLNGPGASQIEAYALTLPEVLSDLARQLSESRQLSGKVRD